jgi:hypothetical protein
MSQCAPVQQYDNKKILKNKKKNKYKLNVS